MVFAQGIEMNATNTVSEIYGFLLGVLIILIGAEESMLSRRLQNVSTVHVCRFYLEKIFFSSNCIYNHFFERRCLQTYEIDAKSVWYVFDGKGRFVN